MAYYTPHSRNESAPEAVKRAGVGMAAQRPQGTTPITAYTNGGYQPTKDGGYGGYNGGGRGRQSRPRQNNAAQQQAEKQAQLNAMLSSAQNNYSATTGNWNIYKGEQEAASQNAYHAILARYQQQLNEQLAAEDAARKDILQRQEEAYGKNVNATNSAYDAIFGREKESYNTNVSAAQKAFNDAVAMLQQNFQGATQNTNQNTERSMQQAFISNEMAKKNMGQELAASGRSGGASETSMLDMANNYGSTRGALDTERNKQLYEIGQEFNANKLNQQNTFNDKSTAYLNDYNANLNGYTQAKNNELLGYETNKNNNILGWDTNAMQRKQSLQDTYTSGLTSAETGKAEQMQNIAAQYAQALQQAREALQQQQAQYYASMM